MRKAREVLLGGMPLPPTAAEMGAARDVLESSREAKKVHSRQITVLLQATARQRLVIENNHLAPSFAAALGGRRS